MNKYDEEGSVYNISDFILFDPAIYMNIYNICKLHLFCTFIISKQNFIIKRWIIFQNKTNI